MDIEYQVANQRTGYMLHAIFNRFFPIIAILVFTHTVYAHDQVLRGEVIKAEGEVHIVDASGERKDVDETSFPVREMDTIVTAEGGSAVVRFTDGALSVLDENSRLQVEKTNWLSHLGGRIYFTFRKVFGERRQVKTRFATLGIRGTTFIVYDDDNRQGVALEEGLLDIESPGPAFEIHRQQQLDEFEAFRQEVLQQKQALQREYDDYKEQVKSEFLEYKTSFSLHPNYVIQFDGIRIDESMFDDKIRAEFESFEAVAGELLNEFREQAYRYRGQLDNEQMLDDEDFE
jgi:hypothetical protein